MPAWNFADVFEAVAERLPDATAQVQGDRVQTWREFDRRSNALAADLLDAGLGHQSKVAAYLYNGPEYLETYNASFKAGLAPVNTNYRYGPEEILYLFDNADAEAVVFHTGFTPLLEKVRPQLPLVKRWYAVDDGVEGAGGEDGRRPGTQGDVPEWAVRYEDAVGAGSDQTVAPWGRSGDDLLLLYTGGTTGMPKGVMWRQEDLFMVLGGGGNPLIGMPPAEDVDDFKSKLVQPGMAMLPACPLMHGTGQFSAFIAMQGGGSIVTLERRGFDAGDLWRTVADKKVNAIVIVGDAFAKPMLAELEANGADYDLSSIVMISSSGVMWSHETKQGLIRHIPQVFLVDSFGSSEAVGMGVSTSAGDKAAETAQFQLGPRVQVFTEDGRRVEPGSDDTGMVAVGGYIPVGYYKDEAKSAATFRVLDGQRWSIPGDFASVNPDGTLHLLGRGSVCINTGGEKVFPEEVEEALKQHPSVRDAVCVGLPDDRFGEIICAVVEPADGATIDDAALIEHVRERLARYKAPRKVIVVDTIGRSPAGKVDYKGLKQLALDRVG